MNSFLKIFALTSSLALSQLAFAQKAPASQQSPFSYNYVQAGYGSASIKSDGVATITLTGYNLSGSAAVTDNVFILGSYQDTSGKLSGVTINSDGWSLGGGARLPMSPATDFVATLSYISQKTSASGEADTTTGYSGNVGIRHLISESVELNGGVGLTISGDNNDRLTDWELGLMFKIAKQVGLGIAYQGSSFDGGSVSGVGAAIRFEF